MMSSFPASLLVRLSAGRAAMATLVFAALSCAQAETPAPATRPAAPAARLFQGTCTINDKTTAVSYRVTRYFHRIGSGGWMTVEGKRYWAVMTTRDGITGLTWYHSPDSTGPEAGSASLKLQPDGAFVGTLQCTDRKGAITATGTLSLTTR